MQEIPDHLRPTNKPRIIDLVAQAGLDTSDWKNSKGGSEKAASNPKYSFEWCFNQGDIFVFNLWFDELEVDENAIFRKLNYRKNSSNLSGPVKARNKRFDDALRRAFNTGSNPRIIILYRPKKEDRATARLLDSEPWTIVSYNFETGDCKLQRGITRKISDPSFDPVAMEFLEGEPYQRFVKHRKRETKLREQKIAAFKKANDGRLFCEVPGCGFDFEETYGALGKGYAQVHHLLQLSHAPDEGIRTTINDLAIVCANCHAMIHRGGECREMAILIERAN